MAKVDIRRTAPEWKSWYTVDDEDGQLRTLGEISEQCSIANRKRFDTERHIAETLGETEVWPRRLIHVIVKQLGPGPALTFLDEALEIERKGGMMLPDGSRRRSPGGLYFFLVKTKGPEEIRNLGMWRRLPRKKAPAAAVLPTKVSAPTAAAINKHRQKVKQGK